MAVKKYMSALSSDGATLAKLIATFSVVLTHAHKIFGYIGVTDAQVFYLRGFHAFSSSGVPVFFLLSGYFLTVKDNFDYRINLKKKFKSLVIPYCGFMLIYTCISCVGSQVLPAFFDDFTKFTARDWLMHLFGIPFVVGPEFYGPFWFIRELFIFNLLSFALVPAVKKIPGYLLIPAMIVLYFLPISRQICYSIPLFLTGMYFGTKKNIPILNHPIHLIVLFAAAFTVPIVFAGGLPRKVSIFLMALSTLMISGKLAERDNLRRMARRAIPYSFPIYAMHEYPMVTIMRLLALKHISLPAAVIAFFTVPFFVIAVCVCVAVIWKRLFPRTYMLFTGGRYELNQRRIEAYA